MDLIQKGSQTAKDGFKNEKEFERFKTYVYK